MLANPMNNQDLMQRSEVAADLRNHEHNKVMGELGHAADHMRKKEAFKGSSVQETQSMELDPDAQNEGQPKQKRRSPKKGNTLEDDTHPHPRQLVGGDHLDLLA